jgi:hypothetical protein
VAITLFPGHECHDGHSFQTIAMSRLAVPRANSTMVTNRGIALSFPVSKVTPPDEDFVKNG